MPPSFHQTSLPRLDSSSAQPQLEQMVRVRTLRNGLPNMRKLRRGSWCGENTGKPSPKADFHRCKQHFFGARATRGSRGPVMSETYLKLQLIGMDLGQDAMTCRLYLGYVDLFNKPLGSFPSAG
jgi:hypothetical protein